MLNKPLISFDYAIKYLLKSREDYDIIEGFISALLATRGYPKVKINALLDAQSNKETARLKQSIADLVVEDEQGNKYIVEVERSYVQHFMHKACFNASRLIVDSIDASYDYSSIKKIFHISLLYFKTAHIQQPLHHGQTIVREIDKKPVDLNLFNAGLVKYELHNIFPEYFFIYVPAFNDVIAEEIDEWLYVMKHSDTKQDFVSPYMSKVQKRLNVLKMSDDERMQYYRYLKDAIHNQDALTTAKEKGRKEGREEGKKDKAMQIARKLRSMGLDTKKIADATGLSHREIDAIEP